MDFFSESAKESSKNWFYLERN